MGIAAVTWLQLWVIVLSFRETISASPAITPGAELQTDYRSFPRNKVRPIIATKVRIIILFSQTLFEILPKIRGGFD